MTRTFVCHVFRDRTKFAFLLAVCLITGVAASAQTTVTTSGGTTDAVPVYTGSATLGNSPIAVNGGNVRIGTT